MPQYFFDTHDGTLLMRDTEGVDIVDQEAARRESHLAIGQMAKDEMPDGDMRNLYVNVRDAGGTPIYTVCMSMVGRWLG